MKGTGRGPGQSAPAKDLYRILSTSIIIYDLAITLLGEPSPEGVSMPDPAHMACVRNILAFLAVDEEEDLSFS
jgi:hypothetical protein